VPIAAEVTQSVAGAAGQDRPRPRTAASPTSFRVSPDRVAF
jgi:hypothetical protein